MSTPKETNKADPSESELKWVTFQQHEPLSGVDKFKSKFTQNPLVPIGTLMTAFILGKGLSAFMKRESVRQQKFMRLRVLSQGFTILAMCVGLLLTKQT
ncbi:hypothetical protein RUM44_000372 [Polyplax serrata]|uniref:HIG1 domain-containing protein n=1 Tax=Polyplax serrata TaxID=468196 RepID=A0ABR1B583_POLSC